MMAQGRVGASGARRRGLAIAAWFAVLCVGRPPAAGAQGKASGGLAPAEARALVVRVIPDTSKVGAGIIIGVDAQHVYIATAHHVIETNSDLRPMTNIRVVFPTPDSTPVAAVLLDSGDIDLDIAVLRVERTANPAAVTRAIASLDRLGSTSHLYEGEPVRPIGCPSGVCWEKPQDASRVTDARNELVFQGSLSGGSSGGAVFNRDWEVVGLAILSAPPRARATKIEYVIERMRAWRYPVSLRAPVVPRAGYWYDVSLSLLTTASKGERFRDGNRLPSVRASVSRRSRGAWFLQASVQRLAPRDLAVSSLLAGAGYHLQYRRLVARPFLEGGLGRTEARYDAGGVTQVTGTTSRYVPRLVSARADGIGLGAGVDLRYVLAPHVIVGVLAGRWSFATPPEARALSPYHVGGGIRWGF